MHLHLHIGAHKTATTHLQNLLEETSEQYSHKTTFLPNSLVREKMIFAGNDLKNEDFQNYCHRLSSSGAEHLIISDENICGHTYHIFKEEQLYQHLKRRLHSLAFLTDMFETINIWLTIRNPLTFMPSIYCEALRWGKFRTFNEVYRGRHQQSWLPVIDNICTVFKEAKINVLLYEHYGKNLPQLFEALTSHCLDIKHASKRHTHQSKNAFSIRLASDIMPLLPGFLHPKIIASIHSVTVPFSPKKYAPFSKEEGIQLNAVYTHDKKSLFSDQRITNFGFGWVRS